MVFVAVVAAAPVRLVTSGSPITVAAPSSYDHVVVALRLAPFAEAVMHRGCPEAIVHRGGPKAVVH